MPSKYEALTEEHLKYCNTEHQATLVDAYIKLGSVRRVATELGVDKSNACKTLSTVLTRAARQGYAPDSDLNHPTPDGYAIKGVSTYYNEDGKITGQWVKTQTDQARQIEMLIERLEEGSTNFKAFKPTKAPKATDKSLLSLLTITDFHLGMYAYEAETGDNWDTNIARQVFLDAIQQMVDASPKAHYGMLNQLGDFLHWDGILAVTPQSGHVLDADTRYSKLVELTMDIMVEAVRIMLAKFGEVIIVQAEGNHDISGSIWLRKHIKHMFKDEPRVSVIDNDFPFYAHLHGKCMLGFHHGHKVKMQQLQRVFSSEPRFRSMWGQADYSYIHCGHFHHERVVEDGGAIVEQHPSLSGRDAYAARGGWVSARGAKIITYHETDGEIHRTTVRPRVQ
jgi:hypothetical protein